MIDNLLKQITDNLNHYIQVLGSRLPFFDYIKRTNHFLYTQILAFDYDLLLLEQRLGQLTTLITRNQQASAFRSFFDFSDTSNVGVDTLAVGSILPGAFQAVKVRSTSEVISFDDTPSEYTESPSVVVIENTQVLFKELNTWRALNMNVLDLSAVAGTGTQVDLSGTALDNQFYLIHIGDDTSVPIILRLGTTFDQARCGYHVYAGAADTNDPGVKYCRAFEGGSIQSHPNWNYDSGHSYLDLYSSLLVRYDSSLNVFITEGQYTTP